MSRFESEGTWFSKEEQAKRSSVKIVTVELYTEPPDVVKVLRSIFDYFDGSAVSQCRLCGGRDLKMLQLYHSKIGNLLEWYRVTNQERFRR